MATLTVDRARYSFTVDYKAYVIRYSALTDTWTISRGEGGGALATTKSMVDAVETIDQMTAAEERVGDSWTTATL